MYPQIELQERADFLHDIFWKLWRTWLSSKYSEMVNSTELSSMGNGSINGSTPGISFKSLVTIFKESYLKTSL